MYSTDFEWAVEITGLLYRGQYTNESFPKLRSTTLELPFPVGRLMVTNFSLLKSLNPVLINKFMVLTQHNYSNTCFWQ